MIPKIIHFIWIGPQPKYVQISIDSYQQLNKDFQINYIHYLDSKIEDIYFNKNIKTNNDRLIYNLLNKIFNKLEYQDIIQQQIKFFRQFGNIPFLQLFCDLLRLELLNVYGGIYVDCDTFAIKSFDKELLSLDNFCVYDKIENFCEINNYFIGSNKKYIDNYFKNTMPIYQTNNYMIKSSFNRPLDFQIRKIKFFTGKLKIEDFKNINSQNYIEHYSDFTWGRKKVKFTKFDQVFDFIYNKKIKNA